MQIAVHAAPWRATAQGDRRGPWRWGPATRPSSRCGGRQRWLPALIAALLCLPAGVEAASPLALPDWIQLKDGGWTATLPMLNGHVAWPTSVNPSAVTTPAPTDPKPCNWHAGMGFIAPDWEDSDARIGVGWLQFDTKTARIERYRCNQQPEQLALIPNYWPTNWPAGQKGNFSLERSLPGSQPCVRIKNEVRCFDLSGPEPVEWTLFTPAQLSAALLPDGPKASLVAKLPANGHVASMDDGAVVHYWDYPHVLPVPGGRIFAIVDARMGLSDGKTYWTAWWLIERKADGAIQTRLGPTFVMSSQQGQPAAGESQAAVGIAHFVGIADRRIAWHAQTNAVFLYDQTPLIVGLDAGGVGIGVLPLDDPTGYGEFDLLRHIGKMSTGIPTNGAYPKHGLVPCPDGRFFVAMGDAGGPKDATQMKLYQLTIDPAGADLDGDGLSAAEEKSLGTSDLHPDSDGGGSPDGTEVRVDGTNPAVASDDRAGLTSETANWSVSALIHARIPVTRFGLTFQWQPSPFVCEKGTCYDATGAVRFEEAGDIRPAVAGDGSVVVWDDGAVVRRRTLATGHDETLATAAELSALLPAWDGEQIRRFPIVGKAGRVYLPRDQGVIVLGDGPARVLWGREAVAAEAGFALEDKFETGVEVAESFELVGYDPTTDRLLAGVRTNYDVSLVSFGVDVAPHVLLHGRDMPRAWLVQDPVSSSKWVKLAPEVFVARSDSGWLARWMAQAYDFRDGAVQPAGGFQYGTIAGTYSAGWGTSMMVAIGGEVNHAFEVVRLDNEIRPGDTVLWRPKTDRPGGLAVSGPRGGILQLMGDDTDQTETIALGASADGRLCRVASDGMLWYFTEPNDRGYPTKGTDIGNAKGAVDCAFDGKGRLTWLAAKPGRIGYLEGDQAFELTLDVDEPRRFAIGSQPGTYRVNAGGAMLCVDWASESKREARFAAAGMTVTRGGWLLALTAPEGDLIRVRDANACDASPELVGKPLAESKSNADFDLRSAVIAERPDGLLAWLPGEVQYKSAKGVINTVLNAYDPRTDKTHILAPHIVSPALAIVPGATWCDPWEPMVAHDPARCWTMPPPGGGGAAGGSAGGGDDGKSNGSCAAGRRPIDGLAPLLLLAALCLLARRRAVSSDAVRQTSE